ncbi:hypothetical protein FRAHR75_1490011 [Frankia sp. Hr75.2]|nr:hypothetical protein FRAHR75_1490011 [Frankia sp. Hr75.2]SQD99340.1 hypothetical protein FMEAI12_5250004 [Parafrankia sp. Ea1.12]
MDGVVGAAGPPPVPPEALAAFVLGGTLTITSRMGVGPTAPGTRHRDPVVDADHIGGTVLAASRAYDSAADQRGYVHHDSWFSLMSLWCTW